MRYAMPALYLAACYASIPLMFLLGGGEGGLQPAALLLPIAAGIAGLVLVLTEGRKWPRETLLNCALAIKYGLIPFYLVGWTLTALILLIAVAPAPMLVLPIGAVATLYGYAVLLGGAPYAIAYIVRSRKEGALARGLAALCGACQFLFALDVLAVMALALRERHAVKTTVAVAVATCIGIVLPWLLMPVSPMLHLL